MIGAAMANRMNQRAPREQDNNPEIIMMLREEVEEAKLFSLDVKEEDYNFSEMEETCDGNQQQ